jgi:hypothetical protein
MTSHNPHDVLPCRLPTILNTGFFIVTLYLTLSIPWNPPLWTGLADPYDYLHQSQIPLRSSEFFFPKKAPPTGRQPINFFPRPFTVPLIYKLANSDPDVIVQIQKYVHCLSAWFLVSSLLPFISSNFIRCLLIICLYLLMSWWNILGWALFLLSESLSTSLLLCWIASFLVLLRRQDVFTLVSHAVIAILFAFTRDTWPYILVAFYIMVLLFSLFNARHLVPSAVALLLIGLVVFTVSNKGATIGQRRSLPLINTIILRVIPNDEYTRWFVTRGLPLAERLQAEFRNTAWLEGRSKINPVAVEKIYHIYADRDYKRLFNWCDSKGERTYVWFLLTHPSFAFLFKESPAQLRRILTYDVGFAPNPRGYSAFAQHIFPVFSLSTLLVLLITSFVLYRRLKREVFLVPISLAVVFCFNTFLLYNADALEVERHLLTTVVMIQLLSIVALALSVDSIWTCLPNTCTRACRLAKHRSPRTNEDSFLRVFAPSKLLKIVYS